MLALQIFKSSPPRAVRKPQLGIEELCPKLLLSGGGNVDPPPVDPPDPGDPPADNGGI